MVKREILHSPHPINTNQTCITRRENLQWISYLLKTMIVSPWAEGHRGKGFITSCKLIALTSFLDLFTDLMALRNQRI